MPRRSPARKSAAIGCACLRIVFGSAVLGGCGGAQAAEWLVEGAASQGVAYDDNVGLNRRNEVSDLSSESTLRLDFSGRTEALEVGLKSRFVYTAFLDESDLDSDDQQVAAYTTYRTPLARLGLTAAFIRDTTRSRDEDDTGVFILQNTRRREVEVKPSWSYRPTPLDSVTVLGELNDVHYDGRLVDYRRYSGEAGWGHKLSEVSEVDLFALAVYNESDGRVEKETQGYGLQAGWSTAPLRGLEIRLVAGAYWARTSFDPPSGQQGSFNTETTVGALPAASISYQIDRRSTVEATYTRTIRPSSSGEVIERDTVDASFVHEWSPRGSLDVQLRYRTQRSLEDDGRAGRDFFRLTPSVVWRLTDAWALRGSYRFRWQSLDNDSKDAISNGVMLTLTYQPMKWRFMH